MTGEPDFIAKFCIGRIDQMKFGKVGWMPVVGGTDAFSMQVMDRLAVEDFYDGIRLGDAGEEGDVGGGIAILGVVEQALVPALDLVWLYHRGEDGSTDREGTDGKARP